MNHFDIEALAAVVAVADHASFTAAAAELNKTQAAVSFTVARLEQRVGDRLFERSRRGATLTPAGQVLAGYARRILNLESEARFAMLGTLASKRIRVGVPDDYLDRFVSEPVEHFMAAYPRIQVEVYCDFSRKLEMMIEERQLDLAIITRDGSKPPRGELLRRESQFWCAGPDRGLEFANPLPLALFPEVCRARPLILRTLDRVGRRWRIAYSCSHLQGICGAVARGAALTVLPGSSVPPNLRQLGPESGLPELPRLELALLARSDACPATHRLAERLRQSFRAEASAA